MIFKVFDGNEGISSKIGVLNKSFAEIGKAFSDALSTSISGFGDGLFGLEEKDQGFLKNFVDNLRTEVDDVEDLYKKLIVTQKDIEPFLKPIDVYDGFDDNKAADVLDKLGKVKKKVDEGSTTWQDYYDTLKPGEEWQAKFVQTMDLTTASIDDVKEAQTAARQAAVNYNNDLGKLTIGAKATKIAMDALAMAGNMVAMYLISSAISFAIKKYKEFFPTVEETRKALNDSKEALENQTKKVDELSKSLDEAQKKLRELQDARGIGDLVSDEDLKKQEQYTNELRMQLQIERERQAIEAKKTLKKVGKAYNNYEQKYDSNGADINNGTFAGNENFIQKSSNIEEELSNTIKAYKSQQDIYDRITSELADLEGKTDKTSIKKFNSLTKQQESVSKQMTTIRETALTLHDDIKAEYDALNDIQNGGENLGETDLEILSKTKTGLDIYDQFVKDIAASVQSDIDVKAEKLKIAQENLQNEYEKIQQWDLGDYEDKIKNGTIQSKFGNVDMDKRTIINWSNELKQTYKDALDSWNYDPEIGSIDTVFGASDRFGEKLKDGGWEVAFTPILPDGTFLSKDTVYDYIETILQEAYKNDNKVTESELKSIDAQGRQIGDTFVQGIFAGIDDSKNYENNGNVADVIGRLMHFSGDYGAITLAKNEIKDLGGEIDNINQKSFNIADTDTTKKIDDFQTKINTLGTAIQNLHDRKLSGSELLDLQQQFPSLIGKTDDLDSALKELVDSTLKDMVNTLKDAKAPDNLIKSFEDLANQAKGLNSADWLGTFDVFDKADSKMQTLAEFTKALGSSYTITATEARKFANVFPELLQLGQVTSTGLIQYNKDVVDNFVNGKQVQINADRDTQISQLESEKAVLEGKRAAAQAALDLIAAQKSGEIDGENQADEKIAEARDNLVQHLMDLGVDEQNADAAAKELMAGNTQEYDRVVAEVSDNIDSNLTNSINDAAGNVNTQAKNMVDSLFGVGKQAFESGKSILNMGTENATDPIKQTIDNIGKSVKDFVKSDAVSNFKKAVSEAVSVDKFKGVDNSVKLELDISNYTSAINEIDSQINLLKAAGNKNVQDYVKDLDSKSGKGSGKDKSDKNDNIFDWMQQKVDLIDKQVDTLKTKIESLVGYKAKNSTTDTVIDLLNDKMTVLNKMAARYREEMNKVGLSDEYKQKIELGTIDIENITDETLSKKISDYQKWFQELTNCNDQITETTASIKELNLSKLDNIIDQYSKMSDIQSQILDTEKSLLDLREKQGDKIFASDYTPLLEGQLSLSKEYADAYNALAAEMSKMDLKKGSDEWKKYNDQLRDYKNNMISAASAVEDYKDAMTELVYKELTDFKSQMDSLNGSISTMSDLIGSTDLVDDAGNLTDRGIAQVALYAKQLANAKQEAAEYAEAIKSLDDALSSGLITQDEYNSMVSEYTSAQESAVKANKEARDAILSLVKDGIQAEIDAKKELTDQTKAALEAEQDLHEYQESIAEKSSNIAKLERQIAALSGSTDRADMAKKLQLQQDLAEAQKDLYNTQYDHEMEQRKQALDDEYDAFEESKNKESDELDTNLDKQNAAIEKYLDKVKANYSTAYNVLQQYGDEYSLAAIDSLTEPWDSSSEAANVCADAIGNVTANIQYEIDSLDFSSLYELADLLNQIGSGTYSGSYSGNFEDITGTGKWQQGKGGRWWYGEDYNENGDYDYASGGIYTIKGKQYGFDDEGYMITGWNDDSGEWRYFEPENGEMVRDSWRESNGKWYYLGSDGAMARDTKVKAMDGNGYYYVGDDGAWDGKEADADDTYKKLKGKKVGYRNGTQNATPGWHRIDEEGLGSEVIVTKDGVLMKMNAGDEVFTKEQTDRLFEILKDPSVMTRGITAFNMKPNTDYVPAPVSQSIEVNMNVGGVVDEATLRVLNEQFPAMIKNNRKLITDTVGKGVKWQLKGK